MCGKMSKFQRWMLKRIAREIVVQGYSHRKKIIEFCKVLVDAARPDILAAIKHIEMERGWR